MSRSVLIHIDPVRESMRRASRLLPRSLDRLVQAFLTWLTGMPLHDERPLLRFSPRLRLLSAVTWIVVGVLGSTLALASLASVDLTVGGNASVLAALEATFAGLGLAVALLVTTAGMRATYFVSHAAVHGVYAPGDLARNERVVRWTSLVLWTLPWAIFRREHIIKHHGRALATLRDADVRDHVSHGLGPGRSRAENWRAFWFGAALSPRWHLRALRARLHANLLADETPRGQRRAFAALLAGQVVLVAVSQSWLVWLVAWMLPLTVLTNASSKTQQLSEHLWLHELGGAKLRLARLTPGRFLGEAFPTGEGASRWGATLSAARWWGRLLGLHLPARVWALPGAELIGHDAHHRWPAQWDWSNGAFHRRDLRDQGSPGQVLPLVDHWGSLADHIHVVFDGWAAMPPLSADELRAAGLE